MNTTATTTEQINRAAEGMMNLITTGRINAKRDDAGIAADVRPLLCGKWDRDAHGDMVDAINVLAELAGEPADYTDGALSYFFIDGFGATLTRVRTAAGIIRKAREVAAEREAHKPKLTTTGATVAAKLAKDGTVHGVMERGNVTVVLTRGTARLSVCTYTDATGEWFTLEDDTKTLAEASTGYAADLEPALRAAAERHDPRRAELPAARRKFIKDRVRWGILSPAAVDMDPAEVVRQHNETNALEPTDRDYLKLPTRADMGFYGWTNWETREVATVLQGESIHDFNNIAALDLDELAEVVEDAADDLTPAPGQSINVNLHEVWASFQPEQ